MEQLKRYTHDLGVHFGFLRKFYHKRIRLRDLPQFPTGSDLKDFRYKFIISSCRSPDEYQSQWVVYFSKYFQFQNHIITDNLTRVLRVIPHDTRFLLLHIKDSKLNTRQLLVLTRHVNLRGISRVLIVAETENPVSKKNVTRIFSSVKPCVNFTFLIVKSSHQTQTVMLRIVDLLKKYNNRLSLWSLNKQLHNSILVTSNYMDTERTFFCV
jgi:hypothetical protein